MPISVEKTLSRHNELNDTRNYALEINGNISTGDF